MFGKKGFRICSIGGIRIYIDWSWIFIFGLVAASLALGVFPRWHPLWSSFEVWLVALVAALLFFISVLAHELAHSLVAKAQGLRVRRIILFLFGGISNIEREPTSAKGEFGMAVVGPLTSIALGIIFSWLAVLAFGGSRLSLYGPVSALSQAGPVATLLLWLSPINILVGLFNLIPAFPLDGGRILRAVIWGVSHDLRKATRIASGLGQAVAWLMIAAGVAMVFGLWIPFLGTGLISGLWLAFIGWFLNEAAASSRLQFAIHELLEDVPVSHLMRAGVMGVSQDTPVDSLVHDWILSTDERAFPVLDGSRLVGLVCLEDVRKLHRDMWKVTSVREIMTPLDHLAVVSPAEDAASAFERLMQRDVRQLPVVEGGKMVGLVRRRDIVRWMQLHSEMAPG
jgi:Zn-dependent protease/predicted transcriptional regulator